MSDEVLPDARAREAALDPGRSFIVQAPAGSGKTELLIQRFLRLLACVEQPEEVIAVTFTLKAAGEMRARVVAAIEQAARNVPPDAPHLRRSWELAREVLTDERRRSWQLERHPARLRIGTIDSLNAWLAGRAPLGAGSATLGRVTDAPDALYREAARWTLALVADDEHGRHVAALLRHLDNDAGRFERLVVAMLPRRDQWLRHLVGTEADRDTLERPLRDLVDHVLGAAAAALGRDLEAGLTALAAFADATCRGSGRESPLGAWRDRVDFPGAHHGELDAWRELAGLLLTAKGEWRKAVNATLGFPPKSAEKTRMEGLLGQLAGRDALLDALREVLALPGASYQDGQWEVLQHLLRVLPLAAAELRLVFAARGEIDFVEVAAAARAALGTEDRPTELGLALDHRIGHILVDEFQDTSVSQFELLAGLTAGWTPGDGRTLFIVGDPMQSIYRFREAEVTLFMQVRDEGIGALRPEFLRLQANFRSRPEIVGWTNSVFARVLPAADDAMTGAVAFAGSNAARPASPSPLSPGVRWHWLAAGQRRAEAACVVDITSRARRAGASVCILVRSRSHAGAILDALRAAKIEFVAPDIEDMGRASVAQDLLALTRALTQPADRLAWIAVLRAPWCGLSLADLHALVATDFERLVPELMRDGAALAALSDEGRGAIARVVEITARAEAARGRIALRDLVEGAWLELGGPATVREREEIETAMEFLALLETIDAGGDCPDAVWLGELMGKRKGSLGAGDPGVQVMTMHKAKGLEFDVVILPGLSRQPRADDARVLSWLEVRTGGEFRTLLAPIGAVAGDGDALHAYVGRMDRRKGACETDRLLYVACTRAREELHLVGTLIADADSGARSPKTGSLLERLWPVVAGEGCAAARAFPVRPPDAEGPVWVQPPIRRFPAGWRRPDPPPALRLVAPEPAPGALEYEWASGWAMHAGSVVHRWLQVIATEGVARFDERRIRDLRPRFELMLERLGTGSGELGPASDRVVAALLATLADERGRWILSPDHAAAENELAMTIVDGERFRHAVVDRTFVDASGERWIVDYKTAAHEGADVEEFLASEAERHAEQLRRYRDAFMATETRKIRTALYFPLLRAFREIDPA